MVAVALSINSSTLAKRGVSLMDEPFQEQIWLSKSVELSQLSINLLTQ